MVKLSLFLRIANPTLLSDNFTIYSDTNGSSLLLNLSTGTSGYGGS